MTLVSMTGFGASSRPFDGPDGPELCQVEIRSVNARFLELKIRQPFGHKVEQQIRGVVDKRLRRGRVELGVVTRRPAAAEDEATDTGSDALRAFGLDEAKVRAAAEAAAVATRIAAEAKLEVSPVSAPELLRFVSAAQRAATPDTSDPPPCLLDVVTEAVDQLHGFRVTEGEALQAALQGLVGDLQGQVAALTAELPGEEARLQERLTERVQHLCERAAVAPPGEDRLAQEIAVLVARGDIEEELARIASHLKKMDATLLAAPHKGQGKTLDFVTQELLREVTTIGSKITSHVGSRIVIDAKATIERIREQVHNVE